MRVPVPCAAALALATACQKDQQQKGSALVIAPGLLPLAAATVVLSALVLHQKWSHAPAAVAAAPHPGRTP